MKNKTTEKIKEEFDKKFANKICLSFECSDAENLIVDIRNFIEHSINQAVEEREKVILEKIKLNFWDGGKNSGLRTLNWDGYSKRAEVKDILDTISNKEYKPI